MVAKNGTNWNDFTKAELIRTVKKLDKRQTALLNEIAKLKGQLEGKLPAPVTPEPMPVQRFPWDKPQAQSTSLPNPFAPGAT